MTSKILKSILSASMLVLLSSLIIITGLLYGHFSRIQRSQLCNELELAAEAVEQLGQDYLAALPETGSRYTWIEADGIVQFDSHADVSVMEIHTEREEINEALKYGTGSSRRYSSTLMQQTVYEAVRLSDGSVLRISVSRDTAFKLVLELLWPLGLITVFAAFLSWWLARRMAKSVVEPLNRLDLEKPLDNDVYDELSPLLHRISSQKKHIAGQMQALRDKQNEFEQISGSMKEALVLLDREGHIVSINPAAKKFFGTDEACIGEDILGLDRSREMQSAINMAMESSQADFETETDGRIYRFELSRIDSDNQALGVVILAHDVTERAKAEKMRREFTANVSHELKTPLQAIMGSAELLESGIVKPEDVPQFVGNIRREAATLVTLIDDIIRLSQIDEEADMPREELSLRTLSLEVFAALKSAAEQNKISLELTGDEGKIVGVRSLLFEAIYNLCDNAIKYNVPGGRVKIEITEDDEELWLSVEDSGIGIAPEHQEKIFERFYRVDKSRSRQTGGTGLGLSIVKHAVQYHGGGISVESEPGKGTVFSLCLPERI